MIKAPLIAGLVLGLPLLIAGSVFGPTAFDLVFHRRPAERFLIPAGYQGWVRVEFRNKGAPPLPIEDKRVLLKLDANGMLRTSSEPQPGHGNDEFFYYSGDHRTPLSNAGVCKGGMIWQTETMVDDATSTPFTRLFVGTEDQYRRAVDPEGKAPACE